MSINFVDFGARCYHSCHVVRAERTLRFVPPAVLTAIIFPELFLPQGSLDVYPGTSRLLAGILAALVAWRTKNVVITILIGMTALLALEALRA